MKLRSMCAENFMPFKKLNISLDNLGITFIDGWNYDDQSASGAGKTAFIDLISFVLFEKNPRNNKRILISQW